MKRRTWTMNKFREPYSSVNYVCLDSVADRDLTYHIYVYGGRMDFLLQFLHTCKLGGFREII